MPESDNVNIATSPMNLLEQASPKNDDASLKVDEGFSSLLGDDCVVTVNSGPPLHTDISARWNALLRTGLEDGKRKDLINKYPAPENCENVIPPKLNSQVKLAISESVERRDSRLSNLQRQVGASLTAIGKVLTSLYEKGEGGDKVNIEALSDAGRLLSDLHFQETRSRRELVLLNINRDLRETLSDVPADEMLFSKDLDEHIKSAKCLAQTGQQLKVSKKLPVKRPVQTSTRQLNLKRPFRPIQGARQDGQLNRQAPPRRFQNTKRPEKFKNQRHRY